MEIKWTGLITLNTNEVEKISEVSGVYRLSYLNNSKEYIVYYVGQADNLKERLKQHLLSSEINTCCINKLKQYNCFFRAAAISRQSDRDGAEVSLYNHFKPTCVERIPDVPPLNINFS